MSEADLTRAVNDYLELCPDILVERMNAGQVKPGVRMHEPGTFDWLLVCGPVCAYVELKAKTGAPNANQRAWLAKAKKLGIEAQVCRSVGDVKAVVDRLRRGRR